ncbi:MAG: NUDIX hydrolase [Candidatus Heimdallarchaeota archaeon]|nr:NUDIX hydrolase [Candidatus Heimdallarchaeota archaeon]
MPTRLAVICVIKNKEGKILLINQIHTSSKSKEGLWLYPGGRLEQGETYVDGAIREVKEETNLIINPISLLGMKNWVMSEKEDEGIQTYFHGVDVILGCDFVEGDSKLNIDEGINKIKFFTLKEIHGLENLQGDVIKFAESMITGKSIPLIKNLHKQGWAERYTFYRH